MPSPAQEPRHCRVAGLTLALLACASAPAQDPQLDPEQAQARFTELFTRAVRRSSQDLEHLRQAREDLQGCAALLPRLPEAIRASASLGVAVRGAELLLLSNAADAGSRASTDLLQARDEARAAGAYRGSYRALLLVLLHRADPGRFAEYIDAEDRAYLLAEDLQRTELARAGYLHVPTRLLRFRLCLGTAAEPAALQDLRALENELRQPGAGATEARTAHRDVVRALVRYHMERRDHDLVEPYLEVLPADEAMLQRALLALQRDEDAATAQRIAEELLAAGKLGADAPALEKILADALEVQGQYAEALAAYDRFLAVATDPHNRTAGLNGRGDCLIGLSRLEEAEAAYRAVLALATSDTKGMQAERAETLKDLGRLEEARGDPAVAYRLFLQATQELSAARADLGSDSFGGHWLDVHSDQLTSVDGLLRVASAAGADPWVVLAATELLKARTALDSAHGSPGPVDLAAVRALEGELLTATEPAQMRVLQRRLAALRADQNVGREAAAAPLDAGGLRRWVGTRPDDLVLSYWVGRDAAWLLWGAGAELRVRRLGSRDDALLRTGAAFRALATPAGDPHEALAAAAEFFLPAEVRQVLDGLPAVVISPDTEIARLPFEALPLGEGWLGTRWAVERAPSLSVAAALQARPRSVGEVVVLDSATNDALESRLGLDPLRFSEREAGLVARAHGAVVRLSAGDASYVELQKALSRGAPALLHVSAHEVESVFAQRMGSLLVLADGAVSPVSMVALPLAGSTVVLSACSAAVGQPLRQEGMLGLPEGALGAGARAVVAPLCAVNQQATSDLMGQFHFFLAGGDDTATAMTRARARLAGEEQYAHPHYWAAFSVVGGYGPRTGGVVTWWLWGGGLALVVGSLWWWARRRWRLRAG